MAGGLSILMPVFNERSTVEAAIDDALTAELPVASRELVIVDDGSTDGTRELLQRHDLARRGQGRLPRTEPRQGRRGAHGLQHATEEFAAILDADLEYQAADLAHVLEPLVSGEAHVVFGTRAWTSQSSFSFWYVMGNKAVTFATNVLYNCWISDVMTCHKAMRTELFRSLPLRERGFAIEPEIAARVLRAGERIHEVPISLPRALARGGQEAHLDGRAARPADAHPLPRDVMRATQLGAYVVLGAALRRHEDLVGTRTRSYWLDEIMTVEEFVRRGPARDPRRPLHPEQPRALQHPRLGRRASALGESEVGAAAARRCCRSSPASRSSPGGCTYGWARSAA